jgi:hypothetical protein
MPRKSPHTNPSAKPWRRSLVRLVILLLILLFGLWLYPVGTHLVRASMVALAVALWMALALLSWRRLWGKIGTLLPIPVVVLVAAGPLGEHPTPRLRNRFIAALQSYEGTDYVRGGENWLGIDCSGLVRRALSDAYVFESLATLDLGLLRESLLLRWFDASAEDLMHEYRNQTRRLYSTSSVYALNSAPLFPGDFAVTADGVHVMAYLGGPVWIAADPEAGRVIKLRPSSRNPWLSAPVVVMTWRALEHR